MVFDDVFEDNRADRHRWWSSGSREYSDVLHCGGMEGQLLGDSVEYMISEYRARKSWERREYQEALEEAAKAAGQANSSGDREGYWRMSLLVAECQQELGLIKDFAASAKLLAEDGFINKAPAMQARALAIHARALQYMGEIGESLAVAKEAAAIQIPEDNLGIGRFDTHHALITSLAETAQLEEAWEVALSMLTLITPQTDDQTAGQAYWAVGNVAFMMEKNEEGRRYHDLAATKLTPSNDVNLWALFNKASAIVRIEANLLDASTLECIERAELAMSVTGGSPADELEVNLVRAHWLVLTGEAEESLRKTEQILVKPELLPRILMAETEHVHALALLSLGRNADALVSAARSEETFLDLGATRKAEQSRELIDTIEARNR